MRYYIVVSLFIMVIFHACKNKPDSNQDQTEITLKKPLIVENIQVDTCYLGCNKKDKNCTYISISYPKIKQAPFQTLMDSLNLSVQNFILAPFLEVKSNSITDLSSSFFKQFDKMNDKSDPMPWYLERNVLFKDLGNGIYTIVCNENSFVGGAHPDFFSLFVNFDSLGNALQIDDLLIANWAHDLSPIAERNFRIQQNIHPETPLDEATYFVFPDEKRGEKMGQFKFPTNFLIKNEGIYFMYNRYEIAPSSNGISEFLLKWTEISKYIKPSGPLGYLLNI